MIWPDLSKIFDDLLWAVVGAVATRLYMPERMTRDLDVVVAAADSANAKTKLQAAPIAAVNLIEGHASWWSQALQEAQSNRDEQGLLILPLHYLVLMKFQAGRVNDIADITRMLGQADEPTLKRTRQLFGQHEPDGLEDLESLIVLGRLELES